MIIVLVPLPTLSHDGRSAYISYVSVEEKRRKAQPLHVKR